MKEIWKPIQNYEQHYLISNFGRVKSLANRKGNWSEKILKPKLMHDGYLCARLNLNKKQKFFTIHRLVAIHFIKNPKNKKEVNHKNFNKTDNTIKNLQWVTPKENIKHARKNKKWKSKYSKYNIPQFKPGLTTTKKGKALYMKAYWGIKKAPQLNVGLPFFLLLAIFADISILYGII